MTGSAREQLGIGSALRIALTLASYFVYVAAAAAGQRNLEVIDLSSTSSAKEVSEARGAFAKGDAIVRMIGGSPADFNRMVGVRIADSKALTQTSNKPGAGPQAGAQLKLQAVAAYMDGKGILRSMLSFAPDGEGWRKRVDDWVAREQSKAAGARLGDPEPPSDAWTLLYSTTILASDYAGSAQSTDAVFRLNTISPTNDFYMVYTVPESTPDYTNIVGAASNCDGISYCGWHTVERDFSTWATSSNGVPGLVDHGPTGTITGSEVSFDIGADLGPEGPGVSAGFSASWSQDSVTTVDHSNSQTGQWQETFTLKSPGDRCLPPGGPTGVSSGTFLSRQAAIFQVPGGTSSFTPSITEQSLFCLYVGPLWDYQGQNGKGAYYDWLSIGAAFPLGPPVLKANPTSLTIPAEGTAPFLVSAYIPGSDQGLPWTITSNQKWLTVPSPGPFSTGQAVPVTVRKGTADGTGGTLSINTSPPFAAPSVMTGPILVNVTVGPSKASARAGILLFGGDPAPDAAEFYDLAGDVALPVKPNLPRPTNSTATLLNTGNILIVGGMTEVQHAPDEHVPVTATAELFNPSSLTFSYTKGSLATARAAHTATLLPDGKVLIVGGVDGNANPLASAELYDPATGTFSSAGSLTYPRSYGYASVISAPGKPTQVLIYGGYTTIPAADAGGELWDEAENAIVGGASMLAPAYDIPQPVAVTSGVLDLVGGFDGSEITAQEQLLNLSGPSFQFGEKLQVPRDFHTLTALPNGAGLLVTGGYTNGSLLSPLASAEIRKSDAWHLLSGTATCPGSPGCMLAGRAGHSATLLPNGIVLLVGGGSDAAESYDPKSETFTVGPGIRNRRFHTATLVVTTVTSLIATPSPSAFGQSVNLAASVSSESGTPTGSVRFLDGSNELGSAQLVDGQASFDVATLSIGSHPLKAVYAGDGISSGSESPVVTQAVSGSTSSTSLSLSPNPSQFGSAVTMTASVTGSNGPVTGKVVFSDNGTQIASVDLAKDGSANAQISNLSVGQHPIAATYIGNENWEGSSSAPVIQTVTAVKVNTGTTLSSNNNPSKSGQSVTFKATVKPVSGTSVPAGTVNFVDGSTVVGTAPLVAGTAKFETSSLTEGTHAMVGEYLGDSHFSVSTSSVLTQTVSSSGGGKVTPTVDLTVNGSTSSTVSAGDTVTFAARIHAATGYPWPTGSITISDSTNANNRYGAVNITKDPNSHDGLATITNPGIGAGSYTLIATYGGDNEGKYYNGAQSNTVSLLVKPKLGGPRPQPSLAIYARKGGRNGTLLLVTLSVTNNGTAPVSGIALNQIALRTLAGAGQASLFAPTVPVIMGELRPGASTVVTLELEVPTTIRKLALSENGTFQDGRGTVYQFSPGQVVFP